MNWRIKAQREEEQDGERWVRLEQMLETVMQGGFSELIEVDGLSWERGEGARVW